MIKRRLFLECGEFLLKYSIGKIICLEVIEQLGAVVSKKITIKTKIKSVPQI